MLFKKEILGSLLLLTLLYGCGRSSFLVRRYQPGIFFERSRDMEKVNAGDLKDQQMNSISAGRQSLIFSNESRTICFQGLAGTLERTDPIVSASKRPSRPQIFHERPMRYSTNDSTAVKPFANEKTSLAFLGVGWLAFIIGVLALFSNLEILALVLLIFGFLAILTAFVLSASARRKRKREVGRGVKVQKSPVLIASMISFFLLLAVAAASVLTLFYFIAKGSVAG